MIKIKGNDIKGKPKLETILAGKWVNGGENRSVKYETLISFRAPYRSFENWAYMMLTKKGEVLIWSFVLTMWVTANCSRDVVDFESARLIAEEHKNPLVVQLMSAILPESV